MARKPKKAIASLKESLEDQVRVLVQAGHITNPHSYVSIWLTCKKMQGDGSARPLPEAGGVLDQDYMLTWAFEILDAAEQRERELQRSMEKERGDREALRQRLLAQR